jgi:hypothetical protein
MSIEKTEILKNIVASPTCDVCHKMIILSQERYDELKQANKLVMCQECLNIMLLSNIECNMYNC